MHHPDKRCLLLCIEEELGRQPFGISPAKMWKEVCDNEDFFIYSKEDVRDALDFLAAAGKAVKLVNGKYVRKGD